MQRCVKSSVTLQDGDALQILTNHFTFWRSKCDIRQRRGLIVTTNYVLAELVSLLRIKMRLPHSTIVGFINDLKVSPIVKIVHIDPVLDAEAWDLFQRRPDKTWSLVDCASFVVMQKRGITEALTSDIHFEQAGFIRLLK
ncbi:MAG: PIN domain-containing protein [Candidatus Fervidibacter sacchari]